MLRTNELQVWFLAEHLVDYQRDLKDVEFHLLDTGHFALEEEGEAIADHIRQFITTPSAERMKV